MSLREQLLRHEGLELKPYRCTSNKLTIGVGRNLEDRGITKNEALYLLDNDIVACRREAETQPWFLALGPVRQDAILNMIFNMGLPRLLGFQKMIAALEAEDWMEAARQALDSRWARQVGSRAEELARQIQTGVEQQ